LIEEPGGTPRQIEAWCKGNCLRNDYFDKDNIRIGFCVYAAGDYIQCLPQETVVTFGRIGLTKGLPVSRLIHPAQIGCCDISQIFGEFSSDRWLLEDYLDKSDFESKVSSAVNKSIDASISSSIYVPSGFTREEMSGYKSFADFIRDHPERSVYRSDIRVDLLFNKSYGTDLVHYKSSQQDEGVEGNWTAVMANTFDVVPDFPFPVVKTSEWTAYFAGEIVESLDINIETIEFAPIGDEVFTLSGLGLQEGSSIRNIREPSRYRNGFVKNGSAVFIEPEVSLTPDTADSKFPVTSSRLARLLLITVLGLSIFATVRRMMRRSIS
jgi:hypothetical protein